MRSVIVVSRVVVLSHHPSDVIAGAVAGTVGALLVRDWFAARRLGFVGSDADGAVRALPGPTWRAHCPGRTPKLGRTAL